MEFMEFFKPHMDLDDQILHYLIGGFGLVIGSLVKKKVEACSRQVLGYESAQAVPAMAGRREDGQS